MRKVDVPRRWTQKRRWWTRSRLERYLTIVALTQLSTSRPIPSQPVHIFSKTARRRSVLSRDRPRSIHTDQVYRDQVQQQLGRLAREGVRAPLPMSGNIGTPRPSPSLREAVLVACSSGLRFIRSSKIMLRVSMLAVGERHDDLQSLPSSSDLTGTSQLISVYNLHHISHFPAHPFLLFPPQHQISRSRPSIAQIPIPLSRDSIIILCKPTLFT
jgi:hypothetical protein